MTLPLVTVLMPVYNAEPYLKDAINSILEQTYRNFEFLIINDGSTDNSERIINSFDDKRIKYVKNNKNIRLIKTLNKGLELSRGKYIARMDADDISLPTRLAKQISVMEKCPQIGILGAWARTFGDHRWIMRPPSNPEEVKASLLFSATLVHPTVVFRKSDFVKHNLFYDEEHIHAEDRELWARASSFFQLSNIEEVTLLYRVHNKSISRKNIEDQISSGNRVAQSQLLKLGINASSEDLFLHRSLSHFDNIHINNYMDMMEKWYCMINEKNKFRKIYNITALEHILKDRWLKVCMKHSMYGLQTWERYKKSVLSDKMSIKNYKQKLELSLKCLIWDFRQ